MDISTIAAVMVGMVVAVLITEPAFLESNRSAAYLIECQGEKSGAYCEDWRAVTKINYRLNFERAEVVELLVQEGARPELLSGCTIFDKKNWTCSGAGFVDGRLSELPDYISSTGWSRYRIVQVIDFVQDWGE